MDQPIKRSASTRMLPRRFYPPLLAGLVMLLCLAMTWQLWDGAAQSRTAERRAAFEMRARDAAGALAQRMAGYVQLLKSVQGLFASSQQVTRSEFADFVFAHELDQQLPGIQAIGFMAAVPAGTLGAHIAQVRAEGVDGYTVWPDAPALFHAPMTYIEPLNSANVRVLGYDGWSEPVRRVMLEQARDSGQPALSGPLTLLQTRDGQALSGFVIALPVYRNGLPRASLEQRRAALAGWVVAPFRAADVVAGLPRQAAGLRLELVDGARPEAGPQASVHAIAIGSQHLHVRISPAAAPAAATGPAPALVAGFGLLVTAVLTSLTWILARSSVAAGRALDRERALAQELEHGRREAVALADAAHHAQAMMRSVLDATIEGILVDDGDGRILVANERFRAMWNVPPRLDMAGDDLALVEHMAAQLAQPGAFLHAHSLPCRDALAQTFYLSLADGRCFEQTRSVMRLGQGSARLWSYLDISERRAPAHSAGLVS